MNDRMSSRDLPVDNFGEKLEKGALALLGGSKDKHRSLSLNLLDLWLLTSVLEDCRKAASNRGSFVTADAGGRESAI